MARDYTPAWAFPGLLDDVRIYNRALSATEVAALAAGNQSTGSGVYVLGSALDVDGQLTINSGQLTTSNGEEITVAGNWNNAGSFVSTGSVIFNGTGNQTLSGSTIFNNFTKMVTTASSLFFDYRARQSFSGALTLQGADGNLLSLRSTKTGSAASLLLDADGGTQDISYVDVRDNDASLGQELDAMPGGVDSGNTTNWNYYREGTGTILGTVWNDSNGDGIKDESELAGLNSVTVDLSGNTATGAALALTDSTTASGSYAFVNIIRSNGSGYTVTVSGATIPAGYLRTTATSTGIVLGTGATITADFGFVQTSTLTGAIFLDTDGNGIKDPAEITVFSGTTLTLTGTSATGGTVRLTTQTNASGTYVFVNLPTSASGFLLVASPPAGYRPVTTNSHTIAVRAGGTAVTQDIGYAMIPEEADSETTPSEDTAGRQEYGGLRTISIRLRMAGSDAKETAEEDAPADHAAAPHREQEFVTAPITDEEADDREPATTPKAFTPITIRYRTLRALGITGSIPASQIRSSAAEQGITDDLLRHVSSFASEVRTLASIGKDTITSLYESAAQRTLRTSIAWLNKSATKNIALNPAFVRLLRNESLSVVGSIPNSVALIDEPASPVLELIAHKEEPRTPLLPSESISAFVPAPVQSPTSSFASRMGSISRIIRQSAESPLRRTVSRWMSAPAPTQMAFSPVTMDQIGTMYPYAIGTIPNSFSLSDTVTKPALELIKREERQPAPLLPSESIGAFVPSERATAKPSIASVIMKGTAEGILENLRRMEMIIENLENGMIETVNDGVEIAGDGWNLMASGMGRAFDVAGDAGGRLLSSSRSFFLDHDDESLRDTPTQHAAAPEQEYRTTLTKKNDVAVIASLHVSVLNSLGVPYAKTPVVLFSTPKIAMTDEEGIATFHDVEVGKHRLEIHVSGDQIETTDIIIEPPSGLSIEEKQSVDVLLPVIRVTVEKQQLHGSAPLSSNVTWSLIVAALTLGLGAGIYLGARRRR